MPMDDMYDPIPEQGEDDRMEMFAALSDGEIQVRVPSMSHTSQ